MAAILFRGSRQNRFLRELAINECVDRRILRRILGGRFNLVSGARCRNGTDAARNPWANGPAKVQIAVWLVGALAVTAIAALVTSRNSPLFSVVAVSVAFGSGYLRLGLQPAAVASLEVVFFGFLFLWQGSFLAPFTAHLAVQAVYLWGAGQLSQDRQSRKTWQIPGTKCPVCQTHLKLLQIKLSEVFECPSCREPLSLSDGYQNVM